MPNTDNDNLIFDHHEHDLDDVCTHEHDNHPRHHHNRSGSVIYLDDLRYVAPVDNPNIDLPHYVGGTDAFGNIGVGGYDVTHRTPRPAPTHRPHH